MDKPGIFETGMNGMTVAMVFSPAVVLVAADWIQAAAVRRIGPAPDAEGLLSRQGTAMPHAAKAVTQGFLSFSRLSGRAGLT
ncbi:hypothetical protein [Roseateles sp.]|uniref:hypothetical protein n=1 Tax=Roseateles sp. TaxID=1971397 RepID=UPI002E07AA0F|nr:hypothetical protein [Roseateles sp.]